ncbi:MAG: VCBS repeat-containing protein [Clostridia bacterium]|nr:VCBS repeat-containing protein [Clostridia bacterium]
MNIRTVTAIIICAVLLLTSCGPAVTDTTDPQTTPEPDVTEPVDIKPLDLAESIECNIEPVYKEKETVRSGEAVIGGLKLNVSYESTFFGAHSAICHPYTRPASAFPVKSVSCPDELTSQLASADMNGDSFADVIAYGGGKLSVYTTSATLKKNVTYLFDSHNKYSASLLFSADIGADAVLCGAGDFDGNGYNDILFYKNGQTVIYHGSQTGLSLSSFLLIEENAGKILCGDVNGDGYCDIITVKDGSVCVYQSSGSGFDKTTESNVKPEISGYDNVICADFNCDKYADLLFLSKGVESCKATTFFGLGDGNFGSDNGNMNLYAEYEFDAKNYPENVAGGDITGNGAADLIGYGKINGKSYNVLCFNNSDLAYDYSLFGMIVDGEYRLYSGCRWSDKNFESSDGDHIMLSTSKDGRNWYRYLEKPMFFLGWELGVEEWWRDNTLEPEVLYVDGKYHMYWQCSYITPKGNYGDKIGYASSGDGVNWERKTDEPAIVCDDPEIGFNHEEVIYVADDPDGKPFWMYTGHFVNGVFHGYIRIRSSDPTRFDYKDKENTDGFSEIGNQIGYLTDKDGNRTFIRITFKTDSSGDAKHTVPTLQFSRDGLRFHGSGDLMFAAVDQDDPRNELNKNVYFLGLATENGTGEIRQNDDGTYTVMYFATTCASSVAPEIFWSEGGVGVATLTLSDIG